MEFAVINTREDLAAIAGTAEYDEFMAMLAGTLWRLQKDDAAKTWVAISDKTVIERFGLTVADFPGAVPPALPTYVAPPANADTLREIDSLERGQMLPRPVREFILASMRKNMSTEQLAASPAYLRIKDLDEKIDELRTIMA
jgi:hypothetical protein